MLRMRCARLAVLCLLGALAGGCRDREAGNLSHQPAADERPISEIHEPPERQQRDTQNELNEKLKAADPAFLQDILTRCRSLVLETAAQQNPGHFTPFILDENTASASQVRALAAGANLRTDGERVRAFQAYRRRSPQDPSLVDSLDLAYLVVVSEDTQPGSHQAVKNFTCRLKPDFQIALLP